VVFIVVFELCVQEKRYCRAYRGQNRQSRGKNGKRELINIVKFNVVNDWSRSCDYARKSEK
jgi:hypothetical protein